MLKIFYLGFKKKGRKPPQLVGMLIARGLFIQTVIIVHITILCITFLQVASLIE